MARTKVRHHGRECDRTLSRPYINALAKKVVAMFRWGVEVELVPVDVYHRLTIVRPLARGEAGAREGRKVDPVEQKHVDAVLRIATPPYAAMIRLQLLTGMRSGEVCGLRMCDIDTTGTPGLWRYAPKDHKTRHRGKDRVIFFGARAQEILRPFLTRDLTAHLFDPWKWQVRCRPVRDGRGGWTFRHSPQPCPRGTGHFYRPAAYCYQIKRYCRLADWLAHKQDPRVPADQVIVRDWHPHQLRHNAATYLRQQFGIEAARVVLGHSSAGVTEIYAEQDVEKAAKIMAQVG